MPFVKNLTDVVPGDRDSLASGLNVASHGQRAVLMSPKAVVLQVTDIEFCGDVPMVGSVGTAIMRHRHVLRDTVTQSVEKTHSALTL